MDKEIRFNEQSEEMQDFITTRITAAIAHSYVTMFNRLKRAGLTPVEIIKLKGTPANITQVKEKLQKGTILIKNMDKNTLEFTEVSE